MPRKDAMPPDTDDMMITAQVQEITPEIAGDLLARPGANRRMSARVVRRYAEAMRNGEWMVTGEPIILSPHGRLLDGQHRLAAIVESGITINTMVVHGVADAAFANMNSGKARTQADALSIAGYTNTARLAATVRAIIAHEWYGDMRPSRLAASSRIYPSNEQVLARLAAEPQIEDVVRRTGSKGLRDLGIVRAVTGAVYYQFQVRDPEAAEEFFALLETGAGLLPGCPIYVLRQRLIANATSLRKLPEEYVAALMVKAWNAWRSGREIKSLSWRATQDPFPTID